VPSRSDDFLFNKIGWLWSINMILNGAWLPTFQSNTTAGFICAQLIIIPMLATALIMGKRTVNNKLTATEMIGFRFGMSIYSGWLSTATILGAAIMLKTWGCSYANGWNEAAWTVTMLWIAFAIYCLNTFLNRDPLFGAVYIWACLGIRSRQIDVWHNSMVESNLLIIIILMSVYVALVTIWIVIV